MVDDDATPEYRAGYAAYVAGEPRESNPHSDDTTAFDEYDEGWRWARQCDDGEGEFARWQPRSAGCHHGA